MKLTIAHLYYDIANLYGEVGNVTVLSDYLRDQGIDVDIEKVTIQEEFTFDRYDLLYIGAMTENNLGIVLEDIRRYRKELAEFLAGGGFVVATGNALELFGQRIGEIEQEGLGLFDYSSRPLKKRLMSEVILGNGEHEVVGFQNQISIVENVKNPWFMSVEQGMGANPDQQYEGIHEGNFFGSYVIGPLFARNPYLTKWFVKEMMKAHGWEEQYSEKSYLFDEKAYESYKNIVKKS